MDERTLKEQIEYDNFMLFVHEVIEDMKNHPCRLVAIDGKSTKYQGDADYGLDPYAKNGRDWSTIK